MVICEVSHQWEAERLRLRSLPPEVHEVMWVNLGQGEVLCQVLRIGHSDPAYAEHCRIVVPPHHVKLKPGEERKTYNRVRMKYLRRRVAESMPRSWSEWLAEVLNLDGGGPEVGLGGRDGGRAGLTRGERPGPSESRHGARVTLRRRSASFLDSVPTRRSPPLTPPLPSPPVSAPPLPPPRRSLSGASSCSRLSGAGPLTRARGWGRPAPRRAWRWRVRRWWSSFPSGRCRGRRREGP